MEHDLERSLVRRILAQGAFARICARVRSTQRERCCSSQESKERSTTRHGTDRDQLLVEAFLVHGSIILRFGPLNVEARPSKAPNGARDELHPDLSRSHAGVAKAKPRGAA